MKRITLRLDKAAFDVLIKVAETYYRIRQDVHPGGRAMTIKEMVVDRLRKTGCIT